MAMRFGKGELATFHLKRIADECKSRTHKFKIPINIPKAAVIIPLLNVDGEARILFQVRSKSLRHHGGEIGFPGGFLESKETEWQAAKREAWEELKWKVTDEMLISDFGKWHNRKSNVDVSPFLVMDPSNTLVDSFTINKAEIDYLIMPKLSDLLDKGKKEYRNLHEGWPPVPFFNIDPNHSIWGFTGFVLDAFLSELFAHHDNNNQSIIDPPS